LVVAIKLYNNSSSRGKRGEKSLVTWSIEPRASISKVRYPYHYTLHAVEIVD
jgi:hypothetical protein